MSTQALRLRVAAPRGLLVLLASVVAPSCSLDWDPKPLDEGGRDESDEDDEASGSADDDSDPFAPPIAKPDAAMPEIDAAVPAQDASMPLHDSALVDATSLEAGMPDAATASCVKLQCAGVNETCNVDGRGVASCGCAKGYERVGAACKNIDECETLKPCATGESCTDKFGSYECTKCLPDENLIKDPGFELQPDNYSVARPWFNTKDGHPGTEEGPHSGSKALWTIAMRGWAESWQPIGVAPNTAYVLKAFVKTSLSPNMNAAIGVRSVPVGNDLVRFKFSQISAGYDEITLTFTTTDQTQVEFYIGNEPLPMYLPTWTILDDVEIKRVTTGNDGCR